MENTKVYFPRSLVPIAATLVRLSDIIVTTAVLLMLMVCYHRFFSWTILTVPLLVLQLTLLAVALGMWFSALNANYRDFSTALPALLQLWMFTSPIVYPASLVPARWKWVYELNPLVGIIDGFRSSLLGLHVNWRGLPISVVISLVLIVHSTYAFWKTGPRVCRSFSGKMFLEDEIGEPGRPYYFFSHNLKHIEQLCSRAFFVRAGKLYEGCDVRTKITKYLTDISWHGERTTTAS